MSKYCPECGKENKDTAKFCLACGEKFEVVGTVPINTPKILDNRYEIISTVKAGGMGCIYKAKDTSLDNIVAVKQMLSSFTNPQDTQYAETRFKEEAKMLSALHHNGLPKVIDYFTTKEPSTGKTLHYLVMTFIEGKDLETIIQERGQKLFPVDEILNYFRQILYILGYLHNQSSPIVYRDLNPRNIMLQNGKIFLVDFGIARLFTPQQKGTAIGTAGYAAPEQYKGAAEPRSDIFSLGAVLHYLLTGKDPEDSSLGNLFSFEKVRTINPAVPEYLDTLIMSMVDIVIDKRPRNIDEVKKALDKKLQPHTQSVQKPQTVSKIVEITTQTVKTPPKVIGRNEDKRYSDIFAAIKAKDFQTVKNFLRNNPSLVNAKGFKGQTPLHVAVENGYQEIVELLISSCSGVNMMGKDNYTPLHAAARCGYLKISELLILKGAYVNARTYRGWTPLLCATNKGHQDIVDLLKRHWAR